MIKFRPNLLLVRDASLVDLDTVTTVIQFSANAIGREIKGFENKNVMRFGIFTDKTNKGFMKDIACHSIKYAMEHGETVMVLVDDDAACYCACRAICELEDKNIYEVFMELKTYWANLDFSPVYYQ